jgi:hypothetical protein
MHLLQQLKLGRTLRTRCHVFGDASLVGRRQRTVQHIGQQVPYFGIHAISH